MPHATTNSHSPRYILGLMTNGHDTAACLLKDGMVAGFIEEERLNRIKHTTAFPFRAIDSLLAAERITMRDVSYAGFTAGYGFQQLKNFVIHFLRDVSLALWPRLIYKNLYSSYTFYRDVGRFRRHYGYRGTIVHIDHHRAHLANAFFPSPFTKSAILSIDGSGEGFSSKMAIGEANRITEIGAITRPESIGILYMLVTHYLGFPHYGDEGKVMGLASYGEPLYADIFRRVIRPIPGGTYRMDPSYFTVTPKGKLILSEKFIAEMGPPRREGEPLTERHHHIAASLQKVTEEMVVHLVRYMHARTGLENICLSGGVLLNSVANGLLHTQTPFRNIFIQPVGYDAGNALGCALAIWHEHLGEPRNFKETHVYWGPSYDAEAVKHMLHEKGIEFRKIDEPEKKAAELIAQGKVAGWFQGRLEAGARALGNRSILADPRRAEMKDIVNNRVKHRESFRPFAPSILEEYLHEYFVDAVPAPFMERVFPIRPEKRSIIPAVTHVDGTGRLQTVSSESNPQYYRLIKYFQGITGIPIVLNTSFNVRGEPMVCAPEEALHDFLATEMDALFLGNFLLEKKVKSESTHTVIVEQSRETADIF